MSINVAMQLYRGTLANLGALATTGKAGVLAWTTDSDELYIDVGSGSAGIGAGKAWQRVAAGNQVFSSTFANLNTLSAAIVGDLAVCTDNTNTYLLTAYPYSTAGNWTLIATGTGTAVTAVNTITPVAGNVTLTLDNIGNGATYGRELLSALTQGEYDLAKSHQLGFTNDNLIQPNAVVARQNTHAYLQGQVIIDPTNSGKAQQCVVAGTSAGSPPTFSATKGATTVDGGATFENIGTFLLVSVAYAAGATTNSWVSFIDNAGVQHTSQPAFSNLSGALTQAQLPAAIGSGSSLTSFDCGTF